MEIPDLQGLHQETTKYDTRRLAISSVHFKPVQKTRQSHVAGMEGNHVCGENLEMVGCPQEWRESVAMVRFGPGPYNCLNGLARLGLSLLFFPVTAPFHLGVAGVVIEVYMACTRRLHQYELERQTDRSITSHCT